MCTVCGCSDGSHTIEDADRKDAVASHLHAGSGQAHHHGHDHDHHHDHGHHRHHHDHGHGTHHHHHHHASARHDHDHEEPPRGHGHGDARLLDCGADPAGQTVAGLSSERIIQVERDILGKNNGLAADNRAKFLADNVLAFNLVSSPGAGKTSLLVRAVSDLQKDHAIGVIEGDQQTSNDAERIRATGAPAIQVNTGKGCHLDAAMVDDDCGESQASVGRVVAHSAQQRQGVIEAHLVANARRDGQPEQIPTVALVDRFRSVVRVVHRGVHVAEEALEGLVAT